MTQGSKRYLGTQFSLHCIWDQDHTYCKGKSSEPFPDRTECLHLDFSELAAGSQHRHHSVWLHISPAPALGYCPGSSRRVAAVGRRTAAFHIHASSGGRREPLKLVGLICCQPHQLLKCDVSPSMYQTACYLIQQEPEYMLYFKHVGSPSHTINPGHV